LGARKPVGLEAPLPPEGRSAPDASKVEAIDVWPTPAVSPVAAKTDDLEEIKKAVDDAASVGGGLWLSYLFVLFYLAVAAGAVTHADLFLENPVKLPFLNIDLPLLAFFFVAPILFLIVHAYTLVHLVMLTEKAKRFHQVLNAPQIDVSDEKRENLQWQLPSNIFIQFLVGPRGIRGGLFGVALRAIAWITLVIAPVLLLLMMQVQFLPFHSLFITWTLRLTIFVDLVLLGWLWRKVLAGPELGGPFRASRVWPVLGVALSLVVVLFSWTVATFPGERQEDALLTWRFPPVGDPSKSANDNPSKLPIWTAPFLNWVGSAGNWVLTKEVSLHDSIFNSEVDPTTRRRRLAFSNTLVLTGFNVLEGLGIDDPKKAEWRDFVFRARGRDLKGARFDFASMPRVDFTGANFQSASLDNAQLDRASFDGAQLQGVSLDGARLKGASLGCAQISSRDILCAQLQGALLDAAQLQGASLHGAQLQGASLYEAQLQGAQLYGAQLQGASLVGAQLQGAALERAQLQGAVLDGAQLQGAALAVAELQGASLQGAQLQGAALDGARLQGAWLDSAELQGASLDLAQLQGASLQRAIVGATDLSGAWLWRTNAEAMPGASRPATVGLSDASWEPSWSDPFSDAYTWDEKAYQNLRKVIEALPAGDLRDQALQNINRLDCASSDKTLASCDSSAAPPPEAAAWRKALEAANVDAKAYALALAKVLKELVCSGGDAAIHVVRGPGFQNRLHAAGDAASDLIGDLASKDSKDCPVAASLTDADRAKLLSIKQATEKGGK
jgi:uncharacterized protein YjbI with pentapeptide repeats